MDAALRASAFRVSARDPVFWGWWLARLRDARNLTPEQQAEGLGLTPVALAYLSLCKVPRPSRRDEDLAAVAGRLVRRAVRGTLVHGSSPSPLATCRASFSHHLRTSSVI
jgi:hypothetical protein